MLHLVNHPLITMKLNKMSDEKRTENCKEEKAEKTVIPQKTVEKWFTFPKTKFA